MTFVKPFTYFFEAAYTRVRVCVWVYYDLLKENSLKTHGGYTQH